VVARGFAPKYAPKHIVPDEGEAAIALEPRNLDQRTPERVLCGLVLNENGGPVPRAIVEPAGVQRGQQGRFAARHRPLSPTAPD
jgi:hypothetical protein